MRYIVFLTLFLPTVVSAQQSSVNANFDEDVFFQLPGNYITVDTLGQMVFISDAENGIVLISKRVFPPDKVHPRNEQELDSFYDSFQRGMVDAGKGTIIISEKFYVDNFKARHVEFTVRSAGVNMISDQVVILIRNVVYVYSYRYSGDDKRRSANERSRLFRSISLRPGTKPDDQFLLPVEKQ